MCMARDVAVAMINKSIDLSVERKDRRYLMDFIKLHKLLYLGQCYILSRYDMSLFNEQIYAYRCGPYVDGIGFVPAEYGFALLDKKIGETVNGRPVIPISYSRSETVDFVLEKYGLMDTDEVVAITKNTTAYQECGRENGNPNYEKSVKTISNIAMAASGKNMFNDFLNN